jgi:hypothetical protein
MESKELLEQEINKRLNNELWDKQIAYNIDRKLSQKKGFLSLIFAAPVLLSLIAFFVVQSYNDAPTDEEIENLMSLSDINFLAIDYDTE